MTDSINLLNLSVHALSDYVAVIGEPRFRAEQLIRWIHQSGVTDFEQMSNLSKSLRARLTEQATVTPPRIVEEQASQDGTCKWLMQLHDANKIETVYIPEKNRGTLCISSQVGCALNCSFCATGKEGFNRNLSLAEIVGQLWMARKRLGEVYPDNPRLITNIVFMGMGEPLLNYKTVVDAVELMLHDLAYGLSKYRVTVSTSGVLPAMQTLKEDSECALAVSLHAPTNELRNQLVPLNKKYPLEQLIPACRDYFPKTSKRQVVFEYVMLANVNDQLEHARALVKLLSECRCKVNLIPFNPFPGTQYETSSPEAVTRFQNYLTERGVQTWVRKRRGDDIAAACGQLAGDIHDRTGRHQRWLRTGRLIPSNEDRADVIRG